ncbi:hypothetical protein ACFX1X_010635 [Malus domestica]
MAYQGATRFHAIYNKTVRSIFDFESFRKLLSSPKSLFWVEMTRHPFGRFTLEWNWEVGFQVLTIMETMKSGFRRLWFFVFWAFSLQPRKPSVLKITSNNLIKVLGGITRIHCRIDYRDLDHLRKKLVPCRFELHVSNPCT